MDGELKNKKRILSGPDPLKRFVYDKKAQNIWLLILKV